MKTIGIETFAIGVFGVRMKWVGSFMIEAIEIRMLIIWVVGIRIVRIRRWIIGIIVIRIGWKWHGFEILEL